MRIKLTKNNKLGRVGDIVEVSKNVGFGLIDSGAGIVSKDMVRGDYKETKNDSISVKKNKV